jgi:hypothetical protein
MFSFVVCCLLFGLFAQLQFFISSLRMLPIHKGTMCMGWRTSRFHHSHWWRLLLCFDQTSLHSTYECKFTLHSFRFSLCALFDLKWVWITSEMYVCCALCVVCLCAWITDINSTTTNCWDWTHHRSLSMGTTLFWVLSAIRSSSNNSNNNK